MAYDIGPRIGIDGEAEFRRQISQINTSIRTLGTEMQVVTSAFAGQERSTEALIAQNNVLSRTVTALEDKLSQQKDMLARCASEYGENSEQTLRWQQAVNQTQAELNRANAQIDANEQALRDNGETVEDTAEKHESAMSKIGAAAKAGLGAAAEAMKSAASAMANLVAEAAQAVMGFAKQSIEVGSAFDSSMSQVAAVSGATGTEFDDLRAKAMEMGAKTKFSATEAADAFNYMAMAGWKTEDMISGIEGIMNLAAASGEELATTSDIVTDALTAFGMKAEDSAHFADILAVASSNANTNVGMMGETFKYVAPVAGALGYSAEDTALAIGLMANSGIKATQAGTALRSIMNRLATNAGATKTQMGALEILTEKLGVEFYNADGSARALNDVLSESRVVWSELSEEQQISYAKTIAGQEAMSGWLAIMNAAPSDIDKLTSAIYDADGAAEAMAATMQDNLAGDITLFQSALESAQITLSDQLTPSLRGFVQFGTEGVAQLTEAFQEGGLSGMMEALGGILAEGITQLTEQLPSFVEAGTKLLGALAEGITAALPSIATAMEKLVGLLISGLESALPKIKEEGPGAIKSFTSGVTQALPEILTTAGSIITQLIEGLTANLPAVVDSAASILSSLVSGIAAQLPTLIPAALDMILTLADALTNPTNLVAIVDSALQLAVSLSGGLVKGIPQIMEKIPTIIQNIVSALTQEFPKILAAGVEIITNLIAGLAVAIPDLLMEIPLIIAAIAQGFAEGGTEVLKIGGNIVEGIWQGILGKAEWIQEQVKGFFNGLIDTVEELLGIHSPSKVFQKEIGENIGLGVAKGIQDSQEMAVSAANLMAQSVYKASKNWLDRNTKYLGLSLSDQLEVWQTIQGQFIESSQQWADAQVEILELQKKIQEEHDNNIIESTKKVVERQNLSLSEQLALWENAQSQLLDSSKQFAEAEKQVYKLREAVAEEHANNIIESTKKVVERQNLSLSEQLSVWENAQDQLLEGSKQFAEAEEQVYKLRKAVAEEFSKTANNLLDEAMKAQEKYDDALSKRTESLYNIYGLFDEASKGEAVNGEKLLSNLEGQIDAMESFYAGLDELSGRGVSDALVDEIRAMGPKAAEELEGLLTMSDDQLEKYNQIYNEKRRLAADLAVEELTELKNETDQKVNDTLTELSQLFDSQAPELGSSLTSGLADGIRSGSSEVVNSVISMAKAAIEAAKSTLMIHSPSQVFSDIGENMALGMSEGWADKFKGVKESIQDSLKFDMGQITLAPNMPGLTLGVERPNYQDLFAGMVNGFQTAAAGNDFPQSATIILQAGDGMTLARWLLPDLRAAMRDDPAPV